MNSTRRLNTTIYLVALFSLIMVLNVIIQSGTIIKTRYEIARHREFLRVTPEVNASRIIDARRRGSNEGKAKADTVTGSAGSTSHHHNTSTPIGPQFQCPLDADPDADAWKDRECKKRLPSVICIGFERCGTDALSFFLSTHPGIKHTIPFSVYYWNYNKDKSISWYQSQMPMSSKHQATMEKTSSYVYDKNIPNQISLKQPDTRFILMVCDPVQRAMSDFLHIHTMNYITDVFEQRPLLSLQEPLPFVTNTFETSVVDNKGNLLLGNPILAHGLYEHYLQEWLKFFPLEQLLILDGTAFKANPLPALQEVENFLGIIPYFDKESIYFDDTKGFFCRAKPIRGCLGVSTGRYHPPIDKAVEAKLRNYYRPYNERLEVMLGRKFPWT